MERIETFGTRALALSRDDFRERHPHPFLVVERDPEKHDDDRHFATSAIPADTAKFESEEDLVDSATSERFVVPVAKAEEGHSFAFVSAGRTRNNDIVLESPFISKCQVLFKVEAPDRTICYETGSTNGTEVNGTRLRANQPTPLSDGDVIDFSGAFSATYFTPEGLHDFLGVVVDGDAD